jgi:hypothetical protein
LGVRHEIGPDTLLTQFDVSKLKHLEVSSCNNAAGFFDGLSGLLPDSGNLTTLLVVLEDVLIPERTVQALEKFLKSSCGLLQLAIDVYGDPMLDTKCFLSHSDTPKSLSLGTGHSEEVKAYMVKARGDILANYPNLEELAINLSEQSLGHIKDLGDSFRLRSHPSTTQDDATKLERMLVSQSAYTLYL